MKRKSLLQFLTVCFALAIAGHVITYLFVFVIESKTSVTGTDKIQIELTKAVNQNCASQESI